MTFGLVDVGYSLPEGQAVKLILFAPWTESNFKANNIAIVAARREIQKSICCIVSLWTQLSKKVDDEGKQTNKPTKNWKKITNQQINSIQYWLSSKCCYSPLKQLEFDWESGKVSYCEVITGLNTTVKKPLNFSEVLTQVVYLFLNFTW